MIEHMTDSPIVQQVRALPERPGVYVMKNARGEVVYVGKAKRLRARVRSYFGSSRALEPKTRALVEQVESLEHIVTANEAEALLLEATLVKRHQPVYNVRLKDDKHYPYLKVDVQNPWPRVTITRRVEDDGARYFGPYASAGSVRRTLDVVKKLFPWRSCTKEITGDDPRPCLDYYIKRCIAPCTSFCTPEEYGAVIDQTLLFLEGRSGEVLRGIEDEMRTSADALEFERAARLRDQAEAVRRVTERQRMATTSALDADVFALAREGDEACVQVFFVRGTVVADTDSFTLDGTKDVSDAEVLGAFLAQFFESATYIPRTVLLSNAPADRDELQAALRERRVDARSTCSCQNAASYEGWSRPPRRTRARRWRCTAYAGSPTATRPRPRSRCCRTSSTCPRARSASSATTSRRSRAATRSPRWWYSRTAARAPRSTDASASRPSRGRTTSPRCTRC